MYGEPQNKAVKHAAVQRLCGGIAIALLLYAFVKSDWPLLLGAGAVLLGSLPQYLVLLRIDLPKPLCAFLRAFSLTVLVGAILIAML